MDLEHPPAGRRVAVLYAAWARVLQIKEPPYKDEAARCKAVFLEQVPRDGQDT